MGLHVSCSRAAQRRLVALVALFLVMPLTLAQDDADWAPFQAPLHDLELHDLELPDPGFLAIDLAGTRYLVEVESGVICGVTSRPTPDFPVARFNAQARWIAGDGRAMFIDVNRSISGVAMTWTSFGAGHESDRVQLFVREDGDLGQVNVRQASGTGASGLWLVRVRPGDDDVQVRSGDGDLPAIRVAEDGLRATVVGVLEADPDAEPDLGAYEGEVTVSVHCPA